MEVPLAVHWKHPLRWYNVLIGSMGRRFVKQPMKELKGVRIRYWNYYPPLVFVATLLLNL